MKEFQERIDKDYERLMDNYRNSTTDEIIDKAKILNSINYAYKYLSEAVIPKELRKAILQLKYPVEAIGEFHYRATTMSFKEFGNLFEESNIRHSLMYDMEHNDDMAVFYRKPGSILDLQEEYAYALGSGYRIEKIVELSDEQYVYFCQNLLCEYPFIASNSHLMWYDSGDECYHCLLVTNASRQDGVLVESAGFNYARYAAFVRNCSTLELGGILVEQYCPPEKDKAKGQPQPER